MLDGSPEKGGRKTVVLTNRADIEKAASFFPGLTEGRRFKLVTTCRSWAPRVRFTFASDSGKTITVVSDYGWWRKPTGGNGEVEVKGDREAYVKELFSEAAAPSAPQD